MRFPQQSTLLRKLGATVLTYPSGFTKVTGEAHWHALLRARAIENQCYVIAAAQSGTHSDKRTSYGHSLVSTFTFDYENIIVTNFILCSLGCRSVGKSNS